MIERAQQASEHDMSQQRRYVGITERGGNDDVGRGRRSGGHF